ncbi:CDP-alcohol phosphatidyltransferase family protein [Thermophagus sp. OGC60D27]|uniref:CDP-alcohol phosphatidyltransferase family protein n=1 Tax=Thermophagus sp. OGC60D27 TaxID=3458415 RepID=UPI004037B8AB
MNKEKIFTIPNLLSLYRLLAFPWILYLIVTRKEALFGVFLVINLVTDILDGLLARILKQRTELGARLDSAADDLTYTLAILGIFVFKQEVMIPHLESFIIFVIFLVLPILLSLIKFGRLPSFHLYSTKAGGYIEGVFFILLFTKHFMEPYYYFMVIWGILASLEHMAIQAIIPEMQSDVKGLYWVLKEALRQKDKSPGAGR